MAVTTVWRAVIFAAAIFFASSSSLVMADGPPKNPQEIYGPRVQPATKGQSRIYLGIHRQFDKTEGIRMGQRVADYVFDNAFQADTRDH
jgi:hypothetical protein